MKQNQTFTLEQISIQVFTLRRGSIENIELSAKYHSRTYDLLQSVALDRLPIILVCYVIARFEDWVSLTAEHEDW